MTERPYDKLTREIQSVSSRPEDTDWVQTAFGILIMNNVRESRAESAVCSCIREITETGQAAHDTLGPPSTWAEAKIAAWKENGAAAFEADEPFTLRTVLLASLSASAFVSGIGWISGALSGSDSGRNQLLLMTLLGFSIMAVLYVYQQVKLRWGFISGVIAAAVTTILVSTGLAFGLQAIAPTNYSLPNWSHLALSAALVALALLLGKALPKPLASSESYDPADNTAWLRGLRYELNKRNDISDARISDEIALVQTHRQETGGTFDEEFGHPAAYARSLAGQKKVVPYRVLLSSVLTLATCIYWFCLALQADDGSSWWRIPLGAVVTILVALGIKDDWKQYRKKTEAA